jgi:hypothetical protein
MANQKISALTELVSPATDDVLAIVDTDVSQTKKITSANLMAGKEPTLGNPASDDYVLVSTALGVRSWKDVNSLISSTTSLAEAWTSGTTKTVTHTFNSRQVMVEVLDAGDDYRTVEVDITRPSDTTVVLNSLIAPTNWLVLLKHIV